MRVNEVGPSGVVPLITSVVPDFATVSGHRLGFSTRVLQVGVVAMAFGVLIYLASRSVDGGWAGILLSGLIPRSQEIDFSQLILDWAEGDVTVPIALGEKARSGFGVDIKINAR